MTSVYTDQLEEPFSWNHDQEHPVRWSPANGDTPAYMTLKGAVERLSRILEIPPAEAEEKLKSGAVIRTMFAFYKIDEEPA